MKVVGQKERRREEGMRLNIRMDKISSCCCLGLLSVYQGKIHVLFCKLNANKLPHTGHVLNRANNQSFHMDLIFIIVSVCMEHSTRVLWEENNERKNC